MYKIKEEFEDTLIPLCEFKEFARITSNIAKDDLLMDNLLDSAIDYLEKMTSLSIKLKTYERIFSWKEVCDLEYDTFELRKGNVTQVDGIVTNSSTAQPIIHGMDNITIDNFKQETMIHVPSASFSMGTHRTRPFVVTFQAGWDEDTLPKKMKTCIMQLALYWYENREVAQIMDNTTVAEMPFGMTAILNSYKLRRL